MQHHHIGHRIRGFYRIAHMGHLSEMTPKAAQERLKILHFCQRHGMAATPDAFEVSRRTVYRWQAASQNPAALTPRSCAPKQRRTPGAGCRSAPTAHGLSQSGQGAPAGVAGALV